MKHILFPKNIDTYNQRLPFFLATEEWAARNLPEGDYFFSWQVDPTVICGRNQEIDKEVDLSYCRENGIDVVRRRSGGGAVFADRENFMFSFITKGDSVMVEFARYTALITDALRNIGINADATGRNDIHINGKKVAGNAFYHIPGRCIAHGTMLYDFNPTHISNALTPSRAKMESKGVKSVPNHVTCLKNENISLSANDFERYMIDRITDGNPYVITPSDYSEIKRIEAGYYDPAFMRIKNPADTGSYFRTPDKGKHICRSARIENLGEFCVDFDLDPSSLIISNFHLSGDFFMNADIDAVICEKLNGTTLSTQSVTELLRKINIHEVIPGLTADTLASIILE